MGRGFTLVEMLITLAVVVLLIAAPLPWQSASGELWAGLQARPLLFLPVLLLCLALLGRLRWLRYVVTRQRLARFDRWSSENNSIYLF